MATSPKKEDSSPLSWIIFASSEVEEDDKAIPKRIDVKKENLKASDNKNIKKIVKRICKVPAKKIIFFKTRSLVKLISRPTVKSKKSMPKNAKLLTASCVGWLLMTFPKISPPMIYPIKGGSFSFLKIKANPKGKVKNIRKSKISVNDISPITKSITRSSVS